MSDLTEITAMIREFRDERDWAQFHQPKEVAIAISLEAGELLEHFLWKSPAEVEARIVTHREEISDELADIAIYLTEFADNLGIDLIAAMKAKLEKNALKYPVERARGNAKKYTEL